MSQFHPVVKLPATYDIFDFSKIDDPNRIRGRYGIGRYNESRLGMYTSDLFSPGQESARHIHVGIDIGAPVGTEVYAFDDGQIFMTGINSAPGDYGGTLMTQHLFQGRALWSLYGHRAHRSILGRLPGDVIQSGDVLGWIGDEKENGGWNPHLHFQLSWKRPLSCDLPGVVSEKDRAQALLDFPDPRIILGPLYSDAALK
jgi:murein DD-endopeptidase MepM/ murein hydrolase activator NlpD